MLEGYAAHVTERVLPAVVDRGRAMFVDAYVDRSAFTVGQARPLFEKARALGLGVRLHAGQFADVGGAELAADVGALSADHLEHVGARGIARMAEANVRAVLLPVASFTLRQDPPPIAALRAAGVPLVVASDANPGRRRRRASPSRWRSRCACTGSPSRRRSSARRARPRRRSASESMPARCARRRGRISWCGISPHENALVQPWGVPRVRAVWRAGRRITGAAAP